MIEKLLGFCKTNMAFVYESSYSIYELLLKCIEKLNEAIDYINTTFTSFQSQLKAKEDSANITKNRKLSPSGDFTGTILGRAVAKIIVDINDSLSLVKTLIQMVNDRESIGTIYDGGLFVETNPPTITIEGGLF